MRNVPVEIMAMIVNDLDEVSIVRLENPDRFFHHIITIGTDSLSCCKKLLITTQLEKDTKMVPFKIASVLCKVKHGMGSSDDCLSKPRFRLRMEPRWIW